MSSEPEQRPNELTERDTAPPGWYPNPLNPNETLFWTGEAWYTSEPGWYPHPYKPSEELYWRGRSWHYVSRPVWVSSMTQAGAPVGKAIVAIIMGVGIPFILWMAYQALPDSPRDGAVLAIVALFWAYAGRQVFQGVETSVDLRDAPPEVQARHRNSTIQNQIAHHEGRLWYSPHSTSGWEDTGCSPGVQCDCRKRKIPLWGLTLRKAPKYGLYAGVGLAGGGAWLMSNNELAVGIVFMLVSIPFMLFAGIAYRRNRAQGWSVKKSWHHPI